MLVISSPDPMPVEEMTVLPALGGVAVAVLPVPVEDKTELITSASFCELMILSATPFKT